MSTCSEPNVRLCGYQLRPDAYQLKFAAMRKCADVDERKKKEEKWQKRHQQQALIRHRFRCARCSWHHMCLVAAKVH